MGTDFFTTGLQKKTEKIGEDLLHSGISKHSDFYGAVWITQNAPFFYGNLRADRVVRPYKEAGRRIRICRRVTAKNPRRRGLVF